MPSLTTPHAVCFSIPDREKPHTSHQEPSKAGREGFARLSSEQQFLTAMMISSLDSPLFKVRHSQENVAYDSVTNKFTN